MSSGGAILDRQNQIHILENHEYEKGLRDIFNLLTVRGEYQVIGSGAIEEVAYGSDYDLQEFVKEPDYIRSTAHLLELFRKKFKDAEKDPDVFILDFKCGVDDEGNAIRWDKKSIAKGFQMVDKRKVTFQECLLMKSTIKMDITALVDGIFIEFSDNYYITLKNFNTFTAVAQSHQDILYSLQSEAKVKYHHGDYWKASKRIFACLKSIGKTKNLIKKLITYFNTETGKLSKNRSELDIIALVVDNKFRKPRKVDIVRNLKIVKDDVAKITKLHVKEDFGHLVDRVCVMPLNKMKPEIEKLSEYLKSVVNADAKQFLDHNPDITHYILNEVAGGSRNSGFIQRFIAEKDKEHPDREELKKKPKLKGKLDIRKIGDPSKWLQENHPAPKPRAKKPTKKALKAELATKLSTASFVPNEEFDKEIREKEVKLKELKNHYESLYIAKGITRELTGRSKSKYSLHESPADYARRYNSLKEDLEDLTGKKYAVLESYADMQKQAKKAEKEDAKVVARVEPPSNEPVYSVKKKKVKGVL